MTRRKILRPSVKSFRETEEIRNVIMHSSSAWTLLPSHKRGGHKLAFVDDHGRYVALNERGEVVSMHAIDAEDALLAPAYVANGPGPLVKQPERVFELLRICIPKRVWNEDLGDYQEAIDTLARNGASAWKLRLAVLSTVFWVLLAAVREVRAAWQGKRSGGG